MHKFDKIVDRFGKGCIFLLLGLCFIITVLECLFMPLTRAYRLMEVNRIRAELPQAVARWQAHNITDYTIDGRVFHPRCFTDLTLTVHNGQLSEVLTSKLLEENLSQLPYGKIVVKPPYNERRCPYQEFLVEKMFERLEQELKDIEVSEGELQVSFDPDFGFISYYHYSCGPTSSCMVEYQFGNLRPLLKQPKKGWAIR